jgi:hypothetical protein
MLQGGNQTDSETKGKVKAKDKDKQQQQQQQPVIVKQQQQQQQQQQKKQQEAEVEVKENNNMKRGTGGGGATRGPSQAETVALQIKRNAEEQRKYASELLSWTKEMKSKDEKILLASSVSVVRPSLSSSSLNLF